MIGESRDEAVCVSVLVCAHIGKIGGGGGEEAKGTREYK